MGAHSPVESVADKEQDEAQGIEHAEMEALPEAERRVRVPVAHVEEAACVRERGAHEREQRGRPPERDAQQTGRVHVVDAEAEVQDEQRVERREGHPEGEARDEHAERAERAEQDRASQQAERAVRRRRYVRVPLLVNAHHAQRRRAMHERSVCTSVSYTCYSTITVLVSVQLMQVS